MRNSEKNISSALFFYRYQCNTSKYY